MRTRTFALAGLTAAVALVAPAPADDTPEFKPFASAAGRYKVVFPGPVKTETVDVKAAARTLKLTLDSVDLGNGSAFYVTHIDYPDAPAVEPAKRLDKVRDGNKGESGTVLSEKDVEVGPDKLPGRDVLIAKPRAHVRTRLVVAGNRLYQVMVQGPKEFVTSPAADRFVNSFEVTK